MGFTACGFARAETVSSRASGYYQRWLDSGHNSCMDYASKYREQRDDPRMLLDGAQTIIVAAINYYPQTFQDSDAAQFAYYAYGDDYHEVVRNRLQPVCEFIKESFGADTRICVDTAPLREKYWAQQAGIGFIGRNNLLIVPNHGSYFFLGEIITTLSIEPDSPCTQTCGDCRLCERSCPGGALHGGEAVDASRCLSCQLIENRGELPEWVKNRSGNQVYGCDECQKCCPHNQFAVPTDIPEFKLREPIKHIKKSEILNMDDDTFRLTFRHSAVKRLKCGNLQRNAKAMTDEPDSE